MGRGRDLLILFGIVAVTLLLLAGDAEGKKKKKRVGDIPVNGGKLTLTHNQIEDFIANSPRTQADQQYFSWTSLSNCIRWGIKGIDHGEMEWLTRAEGDKDQVAGAGVYMASQFTSSKHYGACPVVFTIPKGTILYTPKASVDAFGHALSDRAKVEFGRHVPFLHCDYSDLSEKSGWCVTHHDDLVKRTFQWSEEAVAVPINLERFVPDYKSLMKLILVDWEKDDIRNLERYPKYRAFRDGLGYLHSLYYLMFYMDGLSLLRAIYVAPNDPWSQFEPERFGIYKQARTKYELMSLKGEKIGLSKNGKFGDGVSKKDDWAQDVLDNVLPGLYHDLSATDIRFRDEEVRAGGDDLGDKKMFQTTSQQVVEMKKNPYLTVGGVKEDGEYYVFYYYPDAKYYHGLEGKPDYLSSKMEQRLKAGTEDFKVLTKDLISDLLLNLFKRLHNQPVDLDSPTGLGAILDLVGIHPCSDFNGRTTRFFGQVASLESGQDPAGAFMSDFDLVTDPVVYAKFLRKSTDLYHKLRLAMLEKFIKKVLWEGVKPDGPNSYFALPQWKELLKSLEVFFRFPANIPDLTQTQYDLIRKRRFVKLLDELSGPKKNWNTRNAALAPIISEKVATGSGYDCKKKRRKFRKYKKY